MLSRLMISAVLATTFFAQSAYAFTVDDRSMNNADSASRFSDPDEKTPTAPQFTIRAGSSRFSGNNDGNQPDNSTPPSARAPGLFPFPNRQ